MGGQVTPDKVDWAAKFCNKPDLPDHPDSAGQPTGAADPSVATPAGAPQVQLSGGGPSTYAASLINNPTFEKLIEAMEADADDNDAKWKSQVGDGVFALMPPGVLTQYTADGTDCATARGNFNLEWNKIVGGGGDPAKLLAAYDIFSLRIGALEQSNARVEALIAINFVARFAPFVAFLFNVSKFSQQHRLTQLIADVTQQLQQAESKVTKTEIKAGLNVALSAITMIVAPEAVAAKLAVSLGSIALHIVIDQSLGDGTVTGTVVFVAGDGAELAETTKAGKEAVEALGKNGKKYLGTAAAAITLGLDIHEVYEGKELVEKIAKKLEELKTAYDNLMSGIYPLMSELGLLEALMQALKTELAQAMTKVNDSAKNYDAIKQEIEKAMKEASGS